MRLLSNSQNLQIPFYVVLFIQGSMSRDPPDSMQAIATRMVRVAFSPYFPLLKMSLTVIKYIAVSSSNCR